MTGRAGHIPVDVEEAETGGSNDRTTSTTDPQSCFLNPQNSRMRAWETLIVITILTTFSLDLFIAAFDSRIVALWIVLYTCDILFLMDIVMRFFLGYMKDGILITDSNKIKIHYLRTTFPLDFFTILPTDLLVLAYPGITEPARVWKWVATYRFANRCLRALRLNTYFENRESKLGSNTALLRTLKYTVLAAMVIHLTACGWFYFACSGWHGPDGGYELNCRKNSWARKFGFVGNDTESDKPGDFYVIALYWSVATATSTGYGDISAANELEKWFSIFSMLLGIVVFFGMILGGMASMLTNFDAQRARYTHRFNVIKDTLKDQTVPEDLQKQVIGYYEYLWVRKKGVTDESLINALPLTFHAEVSLSGNKYILDKAPMFQGLSDGFLRMLSLEIKPSLYLPRQTIAGRNEICHDMYFIQRGEIEVLSADDDATPIARLNHGKLFGEVSLIFSMPRTNTIRAAAHCDLMVLDRADLQNVLHHYPEVAKKLQQIAEQRCDAAGLLEERVRAGEGIIPASKSLSRHATHQSRHDSGYPLNSFEAFDMEEMESEWVSVHRGSVVMRTGRHLRILWDDIQSLITDTVVLPNSRFARLWERVVLLVTLIIAFLYPYCASFIANQNKNDENAKENLVLLTLMYLMDFILVIDIIVRLRTAVTTPNGTFKDFHYIRDHYVRSWGFVSDVLAILPLDLFCLLNEGGPERTHALYLLALNRLIKCWRVPNYFKNLEQNLDVNIGTIRIFKFVIYIALLSHWSACLWYLVACPSGNDQGTSTTSSADSMSDQMEKPVPWHEYIISLYWAAATMTSTGYGDISAHTTVGRAIALGAMLVGLLLYGYCLSSIAATLANGDAPRVGFQEKLFAVQEFMKRHNLDTELQQRVINYLSLVFRRHRNETIPGGERIMHDMPIQLQQDIAYQDVEETLSKVPLFKECDCNFLRMLALKLHVYIFMPGDVIVYQGDMGREMYFIRRGTCEVLSKDGKHVMSNIGPGQYFGEVGLIFGDYRTATVRAASYCELLMLKRVDLDEVLQHFPLIEKQFSDAATNQGHLRELRDASRPAHAEPLIPGTVLEAETHGQEEIEMYPAAASLRPIDISIKVFDKKSEDFTEPFQEISFISRVFAKLLMSRAFIPSGTCFKRWEAIRVAVALLAAYVVTLQAAFLHMNIGLWVINYLLDFICFVDMYLKFHTAFYNDSNVLVTHPVSTAKHYLRTNFLIDVLACFPTELIAYAVIGDFSEEAIHLYALVRFNRLLQLYRVPLAFNYLESDVQNLTGNIRMMKFFFYMVLFIHMLACLWYMNACPPVFSFPVPSDVINYRIKTNYHRCWNDSWTSSNDTNFYELSIAAQYLTSLYWASATGASVGYGDIHANNISEMILALFSMIVGIVFFGYIIASVAASLANADAQRARYQEKLTAIKRYLKDQNVEKMLAQHVDIYYNYMWLRTKGVEPDSLFDGLPLSLKADVTLNLYQGIINKVPLFQNTEIGFQKMLAMCIKPVYYLNREYIVRKHDFGKEMFFIHRGVVEVVSEDGAIVFDTMQSGRFFGEISLVFSCPRTASIRAQNNVDMFVLTKEDLDEVLTHYPSIKDQIQKVAEERINAVRKRSEANFQASNTPNNSNNNSIKGSSVNSIEKSENSTASAGSSVPSTSSAQPDNASGQTKPEDGQSSVATATNGRSEAESPSTSVAATPTSAGPPPTAASPPSSRGGATGPAPPPVGNANNNASTGEGSGKGGNQGGNNVSNTQSDPVSAPDSTSSTTHVPTRYPVPFCCIRRDKNYLESLLHANRFVLNPDSLIIRNLARLTCCLAVATSWTIMYQAFYQVKSMPFLLFSYLCECVFIFEIYIKFHVSCADEYGALEKDFGKIYNSYLRKWSGFLQDVVPTIPIELLAFCFHPSIRFPVLSFLRFRQLLRLVRVSQFFDRWERELNINILMVRLTKFFVLLLIIIHLFASIWYTIACPLGKCKEGSWATASLSTPPDYTGTEPHIFHRYCDTIYWAVATLTSTGYGDIHANSVPELAFASMVMVFGKLLFGWVLGNIASTLANEESGRVSYEERLAAVKDQMKDMRLSSKLRNRVISYFDYLWVRNKGVDQSTLFRDAPFCLQTDIGLDVCHGHVKKVPLFKEAEEAFHRALSLMLKPVLFMPNDFIVRQGDVGDEMYFITRGTVEELEVNSQSRVAAILESGDFFDDINLIYDVPRRTSFRARTHVDVQSLSVRDLKMVLEQYPTVEAQIRGIGKEVYGEYAASVNAQEHFPFKQTDV
ncbi:uncharacterized protein [Diadema antillarum]|uniref:uncharacterized protein n=1 Tax=Diadema antillarum TaxID=105358 RepID=UPI003A83C491